MVPGSSSEEDYCFRPCPNCLCNDIYRKEGPVEEFMGTRKKVSLDFFFGMHVFTFFFCCLFLHQESSKKHSSYSAVLFVMHYLLIHSLIFQQFFIKSVTVLHWKFWRWRLLLFKRLFAIQWLSSWLCSVLSYYWDSGPHLQCKTTSEGMAYCVSVYALGVRTHCHLAQMIQTRYQNPIKWFISKMDHLYWILQKKKYVDCHGLYTVYYLFQLSELPLLDLEEYSIINYSEE